MREDGVPAHPQGPQTPQGPQGPLGRQTLERLLSAEGRALLRLLPKGPLDPGEALGVGTRLRERFPAELVAAALAQQELRVRGAAKFSAAGRMWFTREGLEQASGEDLAGHRASRYAGFSVVADL